MKLMTVLTLCLPTRTSGRHIGAKSLKNWSGRGGFEPPTPTLARPCTTLQSPVFAEFSYRIARNTSKTFTHYAPIPRPRLARLPLRPWYYAKIASAIASPPNVQISKVIANATLNAKSDSSGSAVSIAICMLFRRQLRFGIRSNLSVLARACAWD